MHKPVINSFTFLRQRYFDFVSILSMLHLVKLCLILYFNPNEVIYKWMLMCLAVYCVGLPHMGVAMMTCFGSGSSFCSNICYTIVITVCNDDNLYLWCFLVWAIGFEMSNFFLFLADAKMIKSSLVPPEIISSLPASRLRVCNDAQWALPSGTSQLTLNSSPITIFKIAGTENQVREIEIIQKTTP